MSYQLLKEDVLFYQRFLKAAGLYTDIMDGEWGPKTNAADADFTSQSTALAEQFGTFDARSEDSIKTLLPKAQIQARRFLQICKSTGVDARILSGTRTYAEQDVLYAQGRTTPGNIVTNARGGQSNHNFGIAWDIGLFDEEGRYMSDATDYIALSKVILPQMNTLEWGGNWHSIKDNPHYQLKSVSDDVSVVENLFNQGEAFV